MIFATASGDCELIQSGVLGQPINAISSLAFVVVGLGLIRSRPILGWLSCGVGVGSFLFHGPMPPWGEWAHDTTLAAMIAGIILEKRIILLLAVIAAQTVGFAAFPGIAEPVTLAIAGVAVGALVWRQLPVGPSVAAGVVLIGSGVVGALSRTGGPLCHPESLIQGHGIWHLGGALALLIWGRGSPAPAGDQPSTVSTENGPSP